MGGGRRYAAGWRHAEDLFAGSMPTQRWTGKSVSSYSGQLKYRIVRLEMQGILLTATLHLFCRSGAAGSPYVFSMSPNSPSRVMYYAMQVGELFSAHIHAYCGVEQELAADIAPTVPPATQNQPACLLVFSICLTTTCLHACRPTQSLLGRTQQWQRSLRRRPGCCLPARRRCHMPACTTWTRCWRCGRGPRGAGTGASWCCCSASDMP